MWADASTWNDMSTPASAFAVAQNKCTDTVRESHFTYRRVGGNIAEGAPATESRRLLPGEFVVAFALELPPYLR